MFTASVGDNADEVVHRRAEVRAAAAMQPHVLGVTGLLRLVPLADVPAVLLPEIPEHGTKIANQLPHRIPVGRERDYLRHSVLLAHRKR